MTLTRARSVAAMACIVWSLVGCGGSGNTVTTTTPELLDYQALLEKFPGAAPGTGPDVFTNGQTEQPETLAYVLKGEAIRRTASERSTRCIERLLALSDQDADGVAGWGIDQAWDAFGDGTTNPREQVYLVSNAIVLDGLLAALDAGIVPESLLPQAKSMVAQATVSSLASFTESTDGGTFWYSTNPTDAINVPNVNAYLAGVIQKALHRHPELFSSDESVALGNRTDRAVHTLLTKARFGSGGTPYWAYVNENYASPNDLVHHCYTLLGLELYRTYGGRVTIPYTKAQAADSILVFLKNGTPTEYPQDLPSLDPTLRDKPARVWAPGFAIEMLLLLGRDDAIAPFVTSLKQDYGTYPDVRYTPLASLPSPADVFYPRIVAHCLPGLARRATGNLLQ